MAESRCFARKMSALKLRAKSCIPCKKHEVFCSDFKQGTRRWDSAKLAVVNVVSKNQNLVM